MKRTKRDLFLFPPKKTLINRRNCSIGQSCCSMTSKRSIIWFLESSRAWRKFSERSLNQSKATWVCVRFDKPIKSLHLCSFVVFVLFACFHFKVIRKSLYLILKRFLNLVPAFCAKGHKSHKLWSLQCSCIWQKILLRRTRDAGLHWKRWTYSECTLQLLIDINFTPAIDLILRCVAHHKSHLKGQKISLYWTNP